MWKAIQDFLGPVPAPIFVAIFVFGIFIALIITAPTRFVERAQRFIERRRTR